jgi:Tfp pilus assembly protein PilF
MKLHLILLSAVLLTGCATLPPAGNADALLADDLFKPSSESIRTEDIFAMSEPMRQFAATVIASRIRRSGPRRGLFEVLRDELRLDYDAQMTRNAAQAFEARSGNCLSLLLLTAAFAGEFDIPVQFQSVHGYDTWSRGGGLAVLSNHVNLVLGWRTTDPLSLGAQNDVTIDFVPEFVGRRFSTRHISQETVVAMYFNNRAAEILADGDIERAYWWARASVRALPSFVAAQNTLAVIYMRHGNLRQAERALRFALKREPDNPQVLSNLGTTLARLGHDKEAERVKQRLAAIAPYPPFYFLDRGLAALARGEHSAAIGFLQKELRRMPYDEEVNFAMAVADLKLGNLRRARRHMSVALENSVTRDRREIYAAKLKHLEQLTAN